MVNPAEEAYVEYGLGEAEQVIDIILIGCSIGDCQER
jgi:hypothetical protein